MARSNPVPFPGPDEGYPTSRTVDGIDVDRVAERTGAQANLGRCLNQRREWHNSKTGKRIDAPEYAEDVDYGY